jgi:type IV pilus assembly protein PilC
MPLFSYKASDFKGRIIQETIQAANEKDAASIIKADGLQVLTIKNLDSHVVSFFGGGGVSLSEKANFCRFTATMLRAGLPFHEAAEIIRQESGNPRMKKILTDAAYQTRRGKSLSSVLAVYQDVFDPVFLTMIKAGEESGTLDKSFDYLSKQLLANYELSQTIKAALMYPAVVITAMIGVGLLMLLFVLPKISGVFLTMNIELPFFTKVILNIGQFVGKNTIAVLAGVLIFLLMIVLIVILQPTRRQLLVLLSKFSIIQKVFNQIDLARFSRTLATLLKSGVPIIEALNVSSETFSQPKLRKIARKFGQAVAKGKLLSEVLEEQAGKNFPLIVIQTIKTGEKTGTLEDILQELADFYESEVKYSLKKFISLLEPALMLLIGIAVGAMVIMIIAPIYSVVGNLQQAIKK